MMIQWEADSGERRTLVLHQGVLTFGRDADCDVVLDDPRVSRRHFRLRRDGDHLVVESLSRTNALWRNGTQVREAKVHPGDELRAGRTILRVVRRQAPHPAGGGGGGDRRHRFSWAGTD